MSRGPWTHTLCDSCWATKNGVLEPHRVVRGEESERCCQCGKACIGISVREDPAAMRCKGKHV